MKEDGTGNAHRQGQQQIPPLVSSPLSPQLCYPSQQHFVSTQRLQHVEDRGVHQVMAPQYFYQGHLAGQAPQATPHQQRQPAAFPAVQQPAYNFQAMQWHPYPASVPPQAMMSVPSAPHYTNASMAYGLGFMGNPPVGLGAPTGYSWMPLYSNRSGDRAEAHETAMMGQVPPSGFPLHPDVGQFRPEASVVSGSMIEQRWPIDDDAVAGATRIASQKPKLRKTCDACSKHKKACDSRKPCYRCMKRKTACVYSMRKRTGPKGAKGVKSSSDEQDVGSSQGGAESAVENGEQADPADVNETERSDAMNVRGILWAGNTKWNNSDQDSAAAEDSTGLEGDSMMTTRTSSFSSSGAGGVTNGSSVVTDGESSPPPPDEQSGESRQVGFDGEKDMNFEVTKKNSPSRREDESSGDGRRSSIADRNQGKDAQGRGGKRTSDMLSGSPVSNDHRRKEWVRRSAQSSGDQSYAPDAGNKPWVASGTASHHADKHKARQRQQRSK